MHFSDYVDQTVTIETVKLQYKYGKAALHMLLNEAQTSHQAFDDVLKRAPLEDDFKRIVRSLYLSEHLQDKNSAMQPPASAPWDIGYP